MTISLLAVATSATGTIAKTFYNHYMHYKQQIDESEARSEFTYDQAFHIVKAFLEKATSYTIEEVQAFGNTHVPHPPWVTVVRVVIPPETLVVAARVLVDHFGPDEVREVAGGETWWQRRARADGGVEAEWISMSKDYRADEIVEGKTFTERRRAQAKAASSVLKGRKSERGKPAEYTAEMDKEGRCMLYIHGGAHYFGSNNTHRYSIWRYARKMGGRAFSVEYRLSPQYPFPCALQDCLAAYLYLIRPPPEAKHKAIDPALITFAGDSAGGGIVLSLLCLIRDMQLPMPACSVLISPWVDLTHSFPSILQNTSTDIIMPYGFIHKPSALWPPPDEDQQAAIDDQLRKMSRKVTPDGGKGAKDGKSKTAGPVNPSGGSSSAATSASDVSVERDSPEPEKGREKAEDKGEHPNEAEFKPKLEGKTAEEVNYGDRAEPEAVIKLQIDGKDVELSEQIQLYATNDQLSHPLVSPALQPSLGGLSPLLILAGEKEVLRDEIMYVAHRAADPAAYPLRSKLAERWSSRTKLCENYPPTDVHLQVYDGACHVLPLFSFTTPAKYSYRSIASFIRAHTSEMPPTSAPSASPTTSTSPEVVASSVPADLRHEGATTSSPVDTPSSPLAPVVASLSGTSLSKPLAKAKSKSRLTTLFSLSPSPPKAPEDPASVTTATVSSPMEAPRGSGGSSKPSPLEPEPRPLKKRDIKRLKQTIYTETRPFNRPAFENHMIRERVAVDGTIRPLEAASEIAALKLKPDDIGLVKEGPVKRYLEGKRLFDKKYAKTYKRIRKERARHVKKAEQDEESRLTAGLKRMTSRTSQKAKSEADDATSAGLSPAALSKRHGVWDLGDEKPPPSSIAARKDTAEALRLARIVTEQKESLTHPLALWSELHDISFLRHEQHVRDGDDDSSISSSRSTPSSNTGAAASTSKTTADEEHRANGVDGEKPKLHLDTAVPS